MKVCSRILYAEPSICKSRFRRWSFLWTQNRYSTDECASVGIVMQPLYVGAAPPSSAGLLLVDKNNDKKLRQSAPVLHSLFTQEPVEAPRSRH
jgi:hypothetical protein